MRMVPRSYPHQRGVPSGRHIPTRGASREPGWAYSKRCIGAPSWRIYDHAGTDRRRPYSERLRTLLRTLPLMLEFRPFGAEWPAPEAAEEEMLADGHPDPAFCFADSASARRRPRWRRRFDSDPSTRLSRWASSARKPRACESREAAGSVPMATTSWIDFGRDSHHSAALSGIDGRIGHHGVKV